MKKCVLVLLAALLLCGCGAAETFETMGDDYVQQVVQQEKGVQLTVEPDALVLQGDTGTIYICDGYELTVEVYSAGDINGTLQTITGFGAGELTVIETAALDLSRYECVWSAVGEGGDVVGRAVVLDDGAYHYCLTVTASADDALALQAVWQAIVSSFMVS